MGSGGYHPPVFSSAASQHPPQQPAAAAPGAGRGGVGGAGAAAADRRPAQALDRRPRGGRQRPVRVHRRQGPPPRGAGGQPRRQVRRVGAVYRQPADARRGRRCPAGRPAGAAHVLSLGPQRRGEPLSGPARPRRRLRGDRRVHVHAGGGSGDSSAAVHLRYGGRRQPLVAAAPRLALQAPQPPPGDASGPAADAPRYRQYPAGAGKRGARQLAGRRRCGGGRGSRCSRAATNW